MIPSTIRRTSTEQGELTRLTEQKGVVYGAPRFSPSGELLVVELREEIQISDQGVQLSLRDGSDLQQVSALTPLAVTPANFYLVCEKQLELDE